MELGLKSAGEAFLREWMGPDNFEKWLKLAANRPSQNQHTFIQWLLWAGEENLQLQKTLEENLPSKQHGERFRQPDVEMQKMPGMPSLIEANKTTVCPSVTRPVISNQRGDVARSRRIGDQAVGDQDSEMPAHENLRDLIAIPAGVAAAGETWDNSETEGIIRPRMSFNRSGKLGSSAESCTRRGDGLSKQFMQCKTTLNSSHHDSVYKVSSSNMTSHVGLTGADQTRIPNVSTSTPMDHAPMVDMCNTQSAAAPVSETFENKDTIDGTFIKTEIEDVTDQGCDSDIVECFEPEMEQQFQIDTYGAPPVGVKGDFLVEFYETDLKLGPEGDMTNEQVQACRSTDAPLGGSIFKCPGCPKIFDKKFLIVRHYRTHSGFQPFRCKLCGKTSNQRSNMKAHLIGFHGLADPISSSSFNGEFKDAGMS